MGIFLELLEDYPDNKLEIHSASIQIIIDSNDVFPNDKLNFLLGGIEIDLTFSTDTNENITTIIKSDILSSKIVSTLSIINIQISKKILKVWHYGIRNPNYLNCDIDTCMPYPFLQSEYHISKTSEGSSWIINELINTINRQIILKNTRIKLTYIPILDKYEKFLNDQATGYLNYISLSICYQFTMIILDVVQESIYDKISQDDSYSPLSTNVLLLNKRVSDLELKTQYLDRYEWISASAINTKFKNKNIQMNINYITDSFFDQYRIIQYKGGVTFFGNKYKSDGQPHIPLSYPAYDYLTLRDTQYGYLSYQDNQFDPDNNQPEYDGIYWFMNMSKTSPECAYNSNGQLLCYNTMRQFSSGLQSISDSQNWDITNALYKYTLTQTWFLPGLHIPSKKTIINNITTSLNNKQNVDYKFDLNNGLLTISLVENLLNLEIRFEITDILHNHTIIYNDEYKSYPYQADDPRCLLFKSNNILVSGNPCITDLPDCNNIQTDHRMRGNFNLNWRCSRSKPYEDSAFWYQLTPVSAIIKPILNNVNAIESLNTELRIRIDRGYLLPGFWQNYITLSNPILIFDDPTVIVPYVKFQTISGLFYHFIDINNIYVNSDKFSKLFNVGFTLANGQCSSDVRHMTKLDYNTPSEFENICSNMQGGECYYDNLDSWTHVNLVTNPKATGDCTSPNTQDIRNLMLNYYIPDDFIVDTWSWLGITIDGGDNSDNLMLITKQPEHSDYIQIILNPRLDDIEQQLVELEYRLSGLEERVDNVEQALQQQNSIWDILFSIIGVVSTIGDVAGVLFKSIKTKKFTSKNVDKQLNMPGSSTTKPDAKIITDISENLHNKFELEKSSTYDVIDTLYNSDIYAISHGYKKKEIIEPESKINPHQLITVSDFINEAGVISDDVKQLMSFNPIFNAHIQSVVFKDMDLKSFLKLGTNSPYGSVVVYNSPLKPLSSVGKVLNKFWGKSENLDINNKKAKAFLNNNYQKYPFHTAVVTNTIEPDELNRLCYVRRYSGIAEPSVLSPSDVRADGAIIGHVKFEYIVSHNKGEKPTLKNWDETLLNDRYYSEDDVNNIFKQMFIVDDNSMGYNVNEKWELLEQYFRIDYENRRVLDSVPIFNSMYVKLLDSLFDFNTAGGNWKYDVLSSNCQHFAKIYSKLASAGFHNIPGISDSDFTDFVNVFRNKVKQFYSDSIANGDIQDILINNMYKLKDKFLQYTSYLL